MSRSIANTIVPGVVLAIVLGVAAACDAVELEPEPDPDLLGEALAGSAGADGSGFVPVADGTEVELIPGAQGGFHVWLNVSVHGFAGIVLFERRARRASDDVLVFRGLRQLIEVPDQAMDGWWDNPYATPAFMCPSPIGIKVYDEELVFEIELTDEDGEVLATDRLRLIPRCPEGEQAEFCRQICAG
jgi:hypothetical protein